jgi:hypothetical protein
MILPSFPFLGARPKRTSGFPDFSGVFGGRASMLPSGGAPTRLNVVSRDGYAPTEDEQQKIARASASVATKHSVHKTKFLSSGRTGCSWKAR